MDKKYLRIVFFLRAVRCNECTHYFLNWLRFLVNFLMGETKKGFGIDFQNLLSEQSNRVGVNPCGVCNRRNCIRGAVLRDHRCDAALWLGAKCR